MYKNIYIIISLISILILILIIFHKRSKEENLQQNLNAAIDTLTITKLKNQELLYEKKIFILKIDELNKYLNISKKEINTLKKELNSKISYISKISSSIKIDSTININDSIYFINDTIKNIFSYSDKWLQFAGKTLIYKEYSKTTLDKLYIPTNLTIGLTENNDIFVKSENPYLTINNIEGSIIKGSNLNPSSKKFSHGLQLGIGPTYGIINRKFDLSIYLGYGIEFSFK